MRGFAPLALLISLLALTLWLLARAPARPPSARTVPPLPDLPAPVAARIPHTTVRHGETLVDDYAWLRNRDDPAVRVYLEAENAYAAAMLAGTGSLQERLYQEMVSRIPEVEQSLPEVDDQADWLWVRKRDEEHGSFVRRLRRDGANGCCSTSKRPDAAGPMRGCSAKS